MTDEPKWTKGKWKHVDHHGLPFKGAIHCVMANYKVVAVLPADITGLRGVKGDWSMFEERDERDANSKLIEAAPDLYFALQEVHQFLGTPDKHPRDDSGLFELAALVMEALAKARGETVTT